MSIVKTVSPAEQYHRHYGPAIFEPCAQLVIERAAPRPGERVLDLACGTGIVTRRLAAAVGASGAVVGVDLRPGMLAVARELPASAGASIEWRQGDAVALDQPDGAFDLVTCQQGLQFFADRPAALGHVHRVLAARGRLVLAVWRGIEAHPIFEAFIAAELRHLDGLGVNLADLVAPFSLGDTDELRGLLAAAGFHGVEITTVTVACNFAAENFVRDMELAYAAVLPAFVADPDAFERFVSAVEADMRPLVERFGNGDRLRFPMRAHLAVAAE